MKKVFDFLKAHPLLTLMWLVSVALLFVDNESGVMMAMAGSAIPVNGGTNGVAGGDTVHNPANGQPQASNGIAGEATQLGGEATTVSNVAEASDIIEPDIDEDIVQIASDESVIDTIKRKVKRKVRVNSFEVDHYLIDEKPAVLTIADEVTGGTTATLTFDEGTDFMEPYYTASVIGVKGADGADLLLMCVDKNASGNPIVKAVNGEKASSSDSFAKVPTIAKGTKIALLASAAYETQKFIAPSTVVPTPHRMYLQKQLCNHIVSDYFAAQKKRIPFADAVIAEAVLRQFRLESCRTAWIGVKGKVKVKALNPSLGDQFAYTSEGLKWQFKRQESLAPVDGKFGFAQIIDLAMKKFTEYGSSKSATFILGKKLLGAIQKIDYSLHKDITMTEGTAWGVKATKLVTVFGTINLVHDPMLDHLGMEWQGGLIDDEGLVRYYMKNEDNKTEAVEGEEAAEQGDANAQNALGICYKNGEGIEKDLVEAAKWYRKAAEQGHALAQNSLGYCYSSGNGVERDVTEAVKWYRKSAEQAEAKGEFNLGVAYNNGEGVEKNLIEAVKWYKRAAEQGYVKAQFNLGLCYIEGEGVKKDYNEAFEWWKKAAVQGDANSQLNLGVCYYNGEGVEKNIDEAFKWWEKAAAQGHPVAKEKLEELKK